MISYATRTVSATSFDDVQIVLGSQEPADDCQCQLFRLGASDPIPLRRRRELLCAQLGEGQGVVAYVEDDPIGVSRELLDAAVGVARDAGAHAVEAYPMEPRTDPADDRELHVGVLSSFLAAGFRITHTTSVRRSVVRYDL